MTDQSLIALAEKCGASGMTEGAVCFTVEQFQAFAAALAREQEAQPACKGDAGECEYNKACMYACGAAQPAAQEPRIWVEDDICGGRHVMAQHEGYKAFTYASFYYDHAYTDNAGTFAAANKLAIELGATEPVEHRHRGFGEQA